MIQSTLMSAQTATGAGARAQGSRPHRTFQASGSTSSGAGAAVATIQGSNDGVNWLDLGAISLTLGTVQTSDGFSSEAAWLYVRPFLTSISGVGASVTVTMVQESR